MNYHKFLQRQVQKHLSKNIENLAEVQAFLSAMNSIMSDFDKDREITNHAFTESEKEFSAVNENLKKLIYEKNESIAKIENAVKKINPNIELKGDEGMLKISELLNSEITKSKELEMLNAKILESALNAILYFDDEHNIQFWNREAEKVFGYTRQEALKLNFMKLLSAACQVRFSMGLQAYLNSHNEDMINHILESEGITKSGQKIYLEMFVIPLKINDKLLFAAFIQDKTASILAHRKLKEQEERYRNIINNINLGLVEVDNQEKVMFVNQSFTNLSGFSLEELQGKDLSKVLCMASDSLKKVKEKIKLRKEGVSDQYEIMVKDKKGKIRWWVISGSPLKDDNGNIIGSMGIHLDVTDRKKLEESLIHARDVAENTLNIKESILTTMSHEIRTPLNGIIGMLTDISQHNTDSALEKQLNHSMVASNHLLTIVNNILDYSKLEAGKMNLNYKPHRLSDSINRVLQILKTKIKEKNLTVYNDYALSDNYIFDNVKIEQILFNILGNAIKYTDKGNISIQSTAKILNKNTHRIQIGIKDTGIGMDDETIQGLFTKYSQGKVKQNQTQKGTGLGMAITKELTNLMNGRVEVKSEKHQGSEFIFQFDWDVYTGKLIPEDEPIENKRNFKNKKILVVDDNELNRMVALNTLQVTGAELDFAEDATSTLQKLENNEYDLILLDLFMPDKNGNELTEELRQKHQLKTPIIGLSANINDRHIIECKRAGMNDYIPKPYTESELCEAIHKQLFPKEYKCYDLSNLEAMSRGNKEFVQKMIHIFIQNTKEAIPKIQKAFQEQNFDQLHALIHKLKPSVNTLQIDLASQRISQIEKKLDSDARLLENEKDWIDELTTELEKSISALSQEFDF